MMPQIGDALPELRAGPVQAAAMRIWATLLQDSNALHLDPAAVQAAGLGDKVINQGPANLAYMLNAALAAFPGSRILAYDARFTANVFDGDTVITTGNITNIEATPEGTRITCTLSLTVEDRDLAVGGTVVLLGGEKV